jgi:KAP family P-loop domain
MSFSYVPDTPELEPRFDFDLVARGLGGLLIGQSGRSATVVGIHGPWGSGKTTLMEAIERDIPLHRPDAVIVTFNAWKFQDREALWRALILHVLGELKRAKAEAWLAENPEKTADDFRDPKLTELEDKLYRAFVVEEKGAWKVQWSTVLIESVMLGLSVMQLGFVASAVKKSGGWLSSLLGIGGKKAGDEESDGKGISRDRVKEIASILEREVVRRQVNQVQSIEQFLQEFRVLVEEFSAGHRRLFVFIDDLDRCLPESALEVFEAIKLFLDSPGVGYVVALDRDTIRKALAVRYTRQGEATGGQTLLDPDEYIEKTISVSFDIPFLSRTDALDFIAPVELAVTIDEPARALIVGALGTNPRRLRRFMNTLSLNLHIAAASTHGKALLQDSARLGLFLKLLLISYRHTGLFSAARDNPDILASLQQISNAYKEERTNPDTAPDARKNRGEKVGKDWPTLKTLSDREDLWSLFELSPDLNDDPKLVANMVNWFRYRPASGAGAASTQDA